MKDSLILLKILKLRNWKDITKEKILDKDMSDRKEKERPHKTGTYVAKTPKKVAGGRVVKKTSSKSTIKKK